MSADVLGNFKPVKSGEKGSVIKMLLFPLIRKQDCPKNWISITCSLTKNILLDNIQLMVYIANHLIMRKEVLIAIIIGFSLGLVITFGIWTANKAIKQTASNQEEETTQAEQPTPIPSPASIGLQILSPEDNLLVNQEKINISGKVSVAGTIAILYENGEKIIDSDSSGNFSAEITLVGGENEIIVTAYDEAGNEISKSITVIYSTAQI